tara:strand:- start:616 stop:1848 length:1233 start_codon:yes stop_codon:yes gene_type:complete
MKTNLQNKNDRPSLLRGNTWSGLSPILQKVYIDEEEKTKKDEKFETSVIDALKRISQGISYEDWVEGTSMGPQVKAEVKRRLDVQDKSDQAEPEENTSDAKHEKGHITKAVFDSLPDDERDQHQDGLRSAMKSHGMHDDEEEMSSQEEMPPQEMQGQQGDGEDLDYEIGDEDEEVKKEPNMKLSKKKEKVTINPKMESIEFKKTNSSLKDLKKKRNHLIHQLKDIDKEILKNIPNNPEDDLEDYNKKTGLKEKAPPGREDQVKSLKGKVGKDAAYAIAWAQHNKHGRPKSESAQRFKNMVHEKKGLIHNEDFNTSYTNITQSSMSPLEILKTLKDKVDSTDPTKMRGKSWSDMEDERYQQLSAMVRKGKNVLMFLDTPVTGDTYGLEEFVFVMRDKIPKYEEMGYKIVAE